MTRIILKISVLLLSFACLVSCPVMKHFTLKLCTYSAVYYVPDTRSTYELSDSGLRKLRDDFSEVVGVNNREPVFNQDFYCQLKLLPQFTLHVPVGGSIRREAFANRVSNIGTQNATFSYVTDVSKDFEVTTQTYIIHGSDSADFDYKFWYYDENLVNNYVQNQKLELLLENKDLASFDKACAGVQNSWNNNSYGSLTGFFDYNTMVNPNFLDDQLEISFDTSVKTDTVNIFVFIYDKQ